MKELVSKFKNLYKQEPVLVRVPGTLRKEAEPRQYGAGFGLPAANNEDIYFAIAPNGLHLCRVHAFNQKQSDAFFLMHRMSHSSRTWENAIKGVVAKFIKAGYELEGFDLVFGCKTPTGTSLSSAAIERSFAYVLNHLFDCYVEEFMLATTAQNPDYVNS